MFRIQQWRLTEENNWFLSDRYVSVIKELDASIGKVAPVL
jgi:hypothetical protein